MRDYLRFFALLVITSALLCGVGVRTPAPLAQRGPAPGAPAKKAPAAKEAAQKHDPWALGSTGLFGYEDKGKLWITQVSKGSPADGEVKIADEIAQAGTERMGASPIRALMRALAKAQEKGEKGGELALTLKRSDKEVNVTLKIAQIGASRDFHKVANDKAAAMLEGGLAWLVKHQQRGRWHTGLSGTNGMAACAAMAGLAMLAQGGEEYRESLKSISAWMIEDIKGTAVTSPEERKGAPNWNQDNWAWSMSGLFLSEYWLRSKDQKVLKKLAEIADAIIKNQEANGGWAHGPGGKNALNYLDFCQMTLQCLAALQGIQSCGVKLAAEPIKLAKDYVLATLDTKGGVGYSLAKTGALGYSQTGRTSLAALIFADDEEHAKQARLMRGYSYRNRDLAREGHASALMQVVWQTLSLKRFSEEGFSQFMKSNRWFFEASWLHDGSGAAQPNKETLKVGSNFDRQAGQAWTTACLSLAMAARFENLALQGAKVKTWEELDKLAAEKKAADEKAASEKAAKEGDD